MPISPDARDRFVFAVSFEFEGDEFHSQLVWISAPPPGVRMSDERISWMNARAGDGMICHGVRETILAVSLYSAFPSRWNGHEVISGSHWQQDC